MPKITVYGDTQDTTVVATTAISVPSGSTLEPDLDPSAFQVPMQFRDEGLGLGSAGTVNELDFVGGGVTATRAGNKVTVEVPGGGGGGGGGLGVSEGTVPNFTVTEATPVNAGGDTLFDFPTIPAGWEVGAGSMYVRFEIQTTNYFTHNANGHIAVALRRYDPVLPKGGGIALGDLTGADVPRGSRNKPTVQLETFVAGIGPVGRHWMLPGTDLSPNHLLADGQRYQIEIWNNKTQEGMNTLRYRFCKLDANGFDWNEETDTGEVNVDPNNTLDYSGSILTFAEVFRTPAGAWSIAYSNIKWVWGPHFGATPGLSSFLSRKGGDLDGNLRITGSGRLIEIVSTGTAADFTKFTSSADNGDCNLHIMPKGANTHTGVVCVNKSTLTGAFTTSSFQVFNNRMRVKSISFGGAAVPPFDVDINNTIVATFAQNGITVLGAGERIGQSTTRLYGLHSYGSAQALTLTQNAQNMDTYVTPNVIANTVNNGAGLATAAGVEMVLRPAYGMISNIYADLVYRNVI
jgi:hypothetical protein